MTIGKIFLRLSLVLMGVQFLTACASVPVRTAYLDRNLAYSLPENPWSGEPLSAFQQVTVRYEDTFQHFQSIVEIKPGLVKIVMVDLTGYRAMDIRWTDETLETFKAQHVPEQVRAEDILAHIVLAFWPISAAEKGVPPEATLVQSEYTRRIKTATETLILVTRDGENPWTSNTVIDHENSNFQLTISSRLTGVEE